MDFFKVNIFLAICVASAFANPNVISFGDFIEFDYGIHTACENNPSGENQTWAIIGRFTECTQKLSPTPPRDLFENYELFCTQKPTYFACWDKARAEAIQQCGQDKTPILPAVYKATVENFCGNDNGATKIGQLKEAFAQGNPDDETKCPDKAQMHWVDHCKDELDNLNNPNLCTRFGALDTCLGKITCDQVKFAKTLREIYAGGRPLLNCS